MNQQRKREARRNLQLLVEEHLRGSSMRWGATNAQIRAAAKQMVEARRIPRPVAAAVRERLDAIRLEKAGAVL